MGDAEANDELLLANEDAIEEDSIDDKSGSNDATLAAVEPPSSDSGDVVDLDVGEDIIEPVSVSISNHACFRFYFCECVLGELWNGHDEHNRSANCRRSCNE